MDRADATGLGIAAVGHIALLAALILLVPKEPIALPGAPSIEVSFEEEVGIVSAGETTTPAAASVAPELGAPDDAVPAPEPASEPQPQPQPTPTPPQPAPRQASPRPQAPAPQRAAPQQRAAQQPARKAPQPKAATPPGRSGTAPTPRGTRLGRDFLKGIGTDPASTSQKSAGAVVSNEVRADLDSVFAASLRRCMSQPMTVPPGAPVTRVRVDVTFARSGSVANMSSTVLSGANSPYADEYVRAAERVIRQCTPIPRLASEFAQYYEVRRGWRLFRLEFPR